MTALTLWKCRAADSGTAPPSRRCKKRMRYLRHISSRDLRRLRRNNSVSLFIVFDILFCCMSKNLCLKFLYILLCISFFVLPWQFKPARNLAPGLAIIGGILFTVVLGNPFSARTGKMASPLLGTAIVMMGFGLEIRKIAETGISSFGYTAVGIAAAFAMGIVLGRLLKLEHDSYLLISSGTAICGGSAIAAVAPVLNAKAYNVAISTAVVFILNAVALLVFPTIGHYIGLSEDQFGLWSAVAIHDTSSVVGASVQYGDRALEVATTVKLARALWIVPVAFIVSLVVNRRGKPDTKSRIKIPWFIPCFILAATLVSFIPELVPAGKTIGNMSKYLLVTTLFIIGSNVSLGKIRELGFAPILHGTIIWVILSAGWLAAIYANIISV